MDKIICLGKNYLDHAKELGDAVPEKPVLFLKPPSVLKQAYSAGEVLELKLPRKDAGAVHHECEIVLKLSQGGFELSIEEAAAAIESVTLGLDMTLRERQAGLKKAGHPWEISKVFPSSAVAGPWVKVRDFADYLDREFSFELDGTVKQKGTGRQMMFGVAACVAHASQYFELIPGDIVFTGTPAGVGPVLPGQKARLSWGPIQYFVQWSGENS